MFEPGSNIHKQCDVSLSGLSRLYRKIIPVTVESSGNLNCFMIVTRLIFFGSV